MTPTLNRSATVLLMAALAAGATPTRAQDDAAAEAPRAVLEAIRTEATRPNNDPAGRPLPLAASWNVGSVPGTYEPSWQIEQIRQGHHLLPWFTFPNPGARTTDRWRAYYEQPLKQAAQWKLPISFRHTQWEALLYDEDEKWLTLPAAENPNWVDHNGNVWPAVSPMGPVDAWREAGSRFSDGELLRQVQSWYPDPPVIVMFANNEAEMLNWTQADFSKRFVEEYGPNRSNEFKRKVFGDRWIERYGAMMGAIEEGFAQPAWRQRSVWVGYKAFGTERMGLRVNNEGYWEQWRFQLHIPGRITPWPLAWDGASVRAYDKLHERPFGRATWHVWSTQTEVMNYVPMIADAIEMNPDYWLEMSTWDGVEGSGRTRPYRVDPQVGDVVTPDRYGGWIEFDMWVITPRVVREFRGHRSQRQGTVHLFNEIVASVDRVHNSDLLTRFWRKGELVVNPNGKHPFQENIPEYYQDRDRWFLLDASTNPPRPWEMNTELLVYSLARVLGEPGAREWLIFAHAPKTAQQDVTVTLPGFGDVTLDEAPVRGAFYHVQEADRSIERVADQ